MKDRRSSTLCVYRSGLAAVDTAHSEPNVDGRAADVDQPIEAVVLATMPIHKRVISFE